MKINSNILNIRKLILPPCLVSFQSIPGELHIIKREYQNGMYSTLPYFTSKIIAEIPYLFGLSLITMGICYFMIGCCTNKDINVLNY